jgi:hypothetical protein
MKYGKFEIKNYKSVRELSDETECFTLTFYYDGKRCAEVSNRGHGGSDDIYPVSPFTHEDIVRIETEMAEDTFLVDEDTTSEKFSSAIGTLCQLATAEKDLKKTLGKQCVFLKGDEMRTMGYKNKSVAPDQRLFDHVKSAHPDAVILNDKPLDVAVRLVVESEKRAIKAMFETPSAPNL